MTPTEQTAAIIAAFQRAVDRATMPAETKAFIYGLDIGEEERAALLRMIPPEELQRSANMARFVAEVRAVFVGEMTIIDEPLTIQIVQTLMRVTDRFRAAVNQTPVRDMEETLGEVESTIRSIEAAEKRSPEPVSFKEVYAAATAESWESSKELVRNTLDAAGVTYVD
jgi:hypothetical protein